MNFRPFFGEFSKFSEIFGKCLEFFGKLLKCIVVYITRDLILTCSLRSLMSYQGEHKKIKLVSTPGHVIFSIHPTAANYSTALEWHFTLTVLLSFYNILRCFKAHFVYLTAHSGQTL